jgi:photosynthetic reaction center cytochrome c subunit
MKSALRIVAAAATLLALAGCERPPVDSVQHGFRGTGMVQVYNPRTVAAQIPGNVVPEALAAVPDEGPRAREIYQNVQVLGDLSAANFIRLMTAMTQWVSPEGGCNYCHNAQNLADDSVYTKVVARKMLQMTQSVNTRWKSHVADTGVTCWTCHRGQPVPQYTWFTAPPQDLRSNFLGDKAGQNTPAPTVGYASLPYDPFTPYLKDALPIRVIGTEPLPGIDGANNRSSIQQAEHTYALMIHLSSSLGVNCTYCHNTRSMASWEGPPQRATAWYGIRMVRDINNAYLEPITNVFPANRLGELGDVAKTNCATCHQGAYKPLFGNGSLLQAHPELGAAPKAVAPKAAALGMILFAVNRFDLNAEARAAIRAAAAQLASDRALRVDISGFADRTGSADKNLDLAKQRAFAVRDALKAAGVAESRINLRKPEFVIGGTSDESRRVDILPAS